MAKPQRRTPPGIVMTVGVLVALIAMAIVGLVVAAVLVDGPLRELVFRSGMAALATVMVGGTAILTALLALTGTRETAATEADTSEAEQWWESLRWAIDNLDESSQSKRIAAVAMLVHLERSAGDDDARRQLVFSLGDQIWGEASGASTREDPEARMEPTPEPDRAEEE